jgi:hypothetical protein
MANLYGNICQAASATTPASLREAVAALVARMTL